MVPIIERPENADQFDGNVVFLDNYPLDEQVEYWKRKRSSVEFMKDCFPEAFDRFLKLYGREVADEILAIN